MRCWLSRQGKASKQASKQVSKQATKASIDRLAIAYGSCRCPHLARVGAYKQAAPPLRLINIKLGESSGSAQTCKSTGLRENGRVKSYSTCTTTCMYQREMEMGKRDSIEPVSIVERDYPGRLSSLDASTRVPCPLVSSTVIHVQ